MKFEKSCGAIVFNKREEDCRVLVVKHRYGGHWSFPKGHVEQGENESQTALREIREETGLTVSLQEGFRESVEYSPKPGVKKQVVYFIASADSTKTRKQEEEISEICWMSFPEAEKQVTFENDRYLLDKAREYLHLPG